MERLTDDLNIIQNLPNQPTDNASELKAKFDEAPNIIKNYLNNIVAKEIETVQSNVDKKVNTSDFEALKEEINTEIDEKLTSVDNAIDELSNIATQSGDFAFTTVTGQIDHGHGGIKTDVKDISKEGYMPLLISGFKVSGTVTPQYTSAQPQLLSAFLNNRKVGSCKTNVKVLYANNDDWTYKSTYELEIMWIKVKS